MESFEPVQKFKSFKTSDKQIASTVPLDRVLIGNGYLIHRLFRSPMFGSSPKEIPDCKILFCD